MRACRGLFAFLIVEVEDLWVGVRRGVWGWNGTSFNIPSCLYIHFVKLGIIMDLK